MGYHYFDMTKRKDNMPTYNCWITVSKEILKPVTKDGKKKCTREQLNEYNESVKKHKETILALEHGHVLLNNRNINPDSLDNIISYDVFGNSDSRIFRINPIQAIKTQEGYYSSVVYSIQEFDVVSEIKSLEDLVKQTIKDGDDFRLLWASLKYGICSNDGYRDKCLYLFEKCKELSGTIPALTDLIYKKYDHYEKEARFDDDDENARGLIDELLMKNLIVRHREYESAYEPLDAVLRMRWTDIALDLVKDCSDGDKEWITKHNNGEIRKRLALLNDDKNIQEIIKLLNIKSDMIMLKVEEDYDDGYRTRTVETKEFEKMSDIRTYLIQKYNVSFSKASGNINEIYLNDEDDDVEFYGYHFSIVD